MGKDYIDKVEYHAEMVKCKKAGKLSNKIIEMFTLHATEVSRGYWFRDEEEKKDAIASAIHDFVSYWKNFKEFNVIQLKLIRNFRIGETITINVANYGEITYIAGTETDPEKNTFEIKDTTNHSLQILHDLVKEQMKDIIEPSLHKVTMKITFMDVKNGNDLSIKSGVILNVKDAIKNEYSQLILQNTKKILKMLKSIDLIDFNKKQIQKNIQRIEDTDRDQKKNLNMDTFEEYIDNIINMLGTEVLEQMMNDIGKPLTRIDKICENNIYIHKFTAPPNAFNFLTSYCHNGILKGINKTSPKQTRGGVMINLGSINNEANGMYNL